MDTNIKNIILANPNSVLVTIDETGHPVDRVMWTARIEDDMTVYYATYLDSGKVRRAGATPQVLVMWIGEGKLVSLKGTAEITTDQRVLDELWRDNFIAYFPGGKTDPNYAVMRITPEKQSGGEDFVTVQDLRMTE